MSRSLGPATGGHRNLRRQRTRRRGQPPRPRDLSAHHSENTPARQELSGAARSVLLLNAMTAQAPKRMTVEQFVDWAMRLPDGERYELDGGEVVAMAPERARHAKAKLRAARLLEDGVAAAGLACEVYPDGMGVQVDETTVYEPDALVRCGASLDDDAVVVPDPLIVVEVVSPASRGVDRGAKLAGYFRVASVAHYVVVLIERRAVLHHARGEAGVIHTRILTEGALTLDPPGLTLDVAALFAAG